MNVNILLFSDVETLDVFGPVEILGKIDGFSLSFISLEGGLIQSRQGTEIMTRRWDEVDKSGILLIPGGQGTRMWINHHVFMEALTEMARQSTYCLAVCTGSALLAKTGLLNGRKATSNKKSFSWVKSVNSSVEWIHRARWVVDGKFYTSSGVSAGMDMSLGFISDLFGLEQAIKIANHIEYVWHMDKDEDRFCGIH